MKTGRHISYSRSTTEPTRPTLVKEKMFKEKMIKEKILIGRHVPIDVNLDRSDNDYSQSKFKLSKQPGKRLNDAFDDAISEKRNGMTLVTIAFVTLILFLLAGLSIKFSDQTNTKTLVDLGSLIDKSSIGASESNSAVQTPGSDAVGTNKALSEILSARISLISSNNPKFIVTASGEKIVPNDVIDGSLTVVDIFSDYILVSSNGDTREIAY